MSAGRLFEIVYLLLERRRVTAQSLAQRFEVSVRTIYRDVDALSAAGIPVYATPGKHGGVSLMDHYVLDRALFSEAEQQQLMTALQSLSGSIQAEAGDTLSKLSALFRRDQPDWLQVDMSRWGCAGADNAKFERLKSAILTRKVISFTYVSSYGQRTDRRALPARLAFKGQAWYLQCYCLEKQDYRTFKITRMLALSVLDETFTQALNPPPIDGEGSPPFALPVRLRFSPYMAYRVYDEFEESCVTPEPDGTLVVEVPFCEDNWLYGYLLSFGLGVEVLEPPHLRQRLGLLAQKIGQAHLDADTGCQHFGAMMGVSKKQEECSMNQQFCQSCGMPLGADVMGTEKDGTQSPHYCKYCYENGRFTGDMTMEEMIDFCTPHMVEGNPGMTAEQAKAQMAQFFPMLLRWKKG